MKTLICILVALLGLSSFPSHAQPGGTAAPDIGAGKKRAAACFACHGENGIAKIPGTPHLAGQERRYIESALRAYRDGQGRQNATMTAMAKPLTDRDIANIAAYFSLQTRLSDGQSAAQVIDAFERLRPIGTVAVAAAPATAAATTAPAASAAASRSGDAVYAAACSACHQAGIAGAPKFGDKVGWAPRIAQGTATLHQHALQGYQGMPAKGGCASCSDDEVKAAVGYLVSGSR